ncbi:MAG: malonyl-CoA decarboxylase domain-containing protein, partial [Beijerinckiaceae bacterium]
MSFRSGGNVGFLQDLLQNVMDQGRDLVGRAFGSDSQKGNGETLTDHLKSLFSGKGEASGVALAHTIMQQYRQLGPEEKTAFLIRFNQQFSSDPEAIRVAFRNFDTSPSTATLEALSAAVEPPRQEVIRRLNLAPGNTLELVRMREDLLARLQQHGDLAALDYDFAHLFSSWFNRGFLMIRRIDWSTPAYILEKIIQYEAVHAIESWDDLRRRLEPADRRCFAFFHPALVDEPLIFVEVALTRTIPDAIGPILTVDRKPIAPGQATTAVFYSISNCQKGLARISFGNFLIKQVAEELKREIPSLST